MLNPNSKKQPSQAQKMAVEQNQDSQLIKVHPEFQHSLKNTMGQEEYKEILNQLFNALEDLLIEEMFGNNSTQASSSEGDS
jgi:hypothetical protein